MPTTEELVTAVRNGDKAAFSQLVEMYQRAAILTAQAVLGDLDLAQDAAQDGFVIAYTKLNQLYTAAAFGPWLLKIVRRRAGLIRRNSQTKQPSSDITSANITQSSDWIQRYEEVIEQLRRLPEHERMVMVLRYVDGLSIKEIAGTTGRQIETVKKQLSRALARLRKRLTELPS
ncbi:MAG TPA: sigma-70 family RNA polymerase sigma factor [Pirellulales bacterium]|jgi:RNA polymerase sigma-70 factor (ECF subfamily)